MNTESIFANRQPINTTTYKQQAYSAIKDAIIYQQLKADVIYSQETICQELGISRTPVREALLELQKEGYLIFCRGKGVQIAPIDEKEVHDILEIRIYQESVAAELAAKHATQEDIEKIEAALTEQKKHLDSTDFAQSYRLDHAFHRAIGAASHNSILYEEMDNVLDRYLRFEAFSVYKNRADADSIWNEHSAVLEAIKAHDPAAAQKAAWKHLRDSYSRTLNKYWKE